MSSRTTRSAMSSNSVGSRLMMTSAAPLRLAISGNPAAGHTTSDEPIARNRSQSRGQFLGALHRLGRHRLAERHGRGLDVAAAVAIRARGRSTLRILSLHPGQFVALRAIEADRVGRVAVQLDDVVRRNARCLMQIVDVLRHHRRAPCRRGKDLRARDGRGRAWPWRNCSSMAKRRRQASSRISWLARNSSNGIGRFLVHKPAGRAEIRNAAFGRDAGAGERHDRARAFDQLAQAGDRGLEIGGDHLCIVPREPGQPGFQ